MCLEIMSVTKDEISKLLKTLFQHLKYFKKYFFTENNVIFLDIDKNKKVNCMSIIRISEMV